MSATGSSSFHRREVTIRSADRRSHAIGTSGRTASRSSARTGPPITSDTSFAETDVRPGGAFRIGMRPADHSHEGFVLDGTYREIVTPERIVQVIGDGRIMTAKFEDVSGKTRFTLSVEMAMSEEQERQGYTQILDHFTAHIAKLSGTRH